MNRKTLVILCCVALLVCCEKTEKEYVREDLHYADVFKALDWGSETTFVFGHKTPDTDATCSAMAYAELMKQLGYNCKAFVLGEVNNETKFAANYFGFTTPEILDSVAPGQRVILVDHSEYLQSVKGVEKAKILQVVDHHGLGDITESSMLYYKAMPIGSTCSIVYTSYKETGVAIPDSIAQVLLAGILSDTGKLTKATTTYVDTMAYYALVAQLKMETEVDSMYKQMHYAASSYYGMTDEEIFYSDSKDYKYGGYQFCIGNVGWYDSATMDDFIDRMYVLMPKVLKDKGQDIEFCKVDQFKPNPDTTSDEEYLDDGTYILYYGEGAKEIAVKAFVDNSNGDGTLLREGVIFCKIHKSRKADVVPALYKAIDEINAK